MENQKQITKGLTPKQTKYIVFTIIALILVLILGLLKMLIILAIGIIIWWIWKKSNFNKNKKIKVTVGVVIVLIILNGFLAYINRAPTILITSPNDNSSIETKDIAINGSVTPVSSTLTINSVTVKIDKGHFNYATPLLSENNRINITAENGGKTVTRTLNITRIFTEQEKAEIALAKAKKEADIASAKAKEEARIKAEKDSYEATPAGRVCKKNPDWSKKDCEGVANKEIWIGMSIDMLHAVRGLPDRVNPSNYGDGVRYQWCWSDHTPSCFYGGANGIITSYN